ncbi:hypothetical protein R1flu_002080 [Riccia fluitans]|uniref:Uncharacterized protein n=1 Tax=Riccia fluitans TaxID=41844 RepID=A0ABD1Y5L1_9MARC
MALEREGSSNPKGSRSPRAGFYKLKKVKRAWLNGGSSNNDSDGGDPKDDGPNSRPEDESSDMEGSFDKDINEIQVQCQCRSKLPEPTKSPKYDRTRGLIAFKEVDREDEELLPLFRKLQRLHNGDQFND